METDLNTLTILAEVTTAFVAFAAIVASLRVTLGKELSPFQRLLVHFFTEAGMLNVSFTLLPLVLAGFWQDELIIARFTSVYVIAGSGTYLVFYIRRRLSIKAPTPLLSLVVMIGYGIWLPLLAITVTGIYWQPSLEIIAAYCFWSLFTSVVIFASFLASFVQSEERNMGTQ